MIEVVSKTVSGKSLSGRVVTMNVRINGKPRVRTFDVDPGVNGHFRTVYELRQVGRKQRWCAVRDDFLFGELQAIAACPGVPATAAN